VYESIHSPQQRTHPLPAGKQYPCFFVDGPGGTGKTFLYNCLIHTMAADGVPVIAVAFTGCAAMLLCRGRTAHSQFRIPIPMFSDSSCGIGHGDPVAQVIRDARLILFDEAPMVSADILSAIDRMLRDITQCQAPFGDKVMLLGGDFRQVLPIVPRRGRAHIVSVLINRCALWQHFSVFRLSINMRAGAAQQQFASWLLRLGEGVDNTGDNNDKIVLPARCVLPPPPDVPANGDTHSDLITKIFGPGVLSDVNALAGRAILTPHNDDALDVNEEVLNRLPGAVLTSHSIDGVECDDPMEAAHYPVEFLNSLTPSGMPVSKLRLKVGCVVMLLRNIDVRQHLVNGTRLVVRRVCTHVLECERITQVQGSGLQRRVFIPRIALTPSDTNIPFKLCRRQFPIRLAFAMTINKSQGQTLERAGILLTRPVFGHGQLYVAFSRVRSLECVKVRIMHADDSEPLTTKNVVWKEVFQG
jgi:ATP-dependent DNA helicase PIF1